MRLFDAKIDCRKLQLNNKGHLALLKESFDEGIVRGEQMMTDFNMHEIWRTNAMYREGFQTPIGFTNDALRTIVAKNKDRFEIDYDTPQYQKLNPPDPRMRFDATEFRLKKNKRNKLWYIDNKIGDYIDGLIDEFTQVRKNVEVKNGTDPKHTSIEHAVRNELEDFNKTKKIWTDIRIPLIELRFIYGLAFSRTVFNAFVNIKGGNMGDIDMEYLKPWEVLLDSLGPYKKYFQHIRYLIPKMKMELNAAKRYFEHFGIDPDKVSPDTDYDFNTQTSQITIAEANRGIDYVTIYKPEFRVFYSEKYKIPLSEMGISEAELAEMTMSGQPLPKELSELQVYYFKALYNKQLGCVHYTRNYYADPELLTTWQFQTVCYADKTSELRPYPVSKAEKLINVQDLINLIKSLKLNNVRDKATIRGLMIEALYNQYDDATMRDFIDKGGILKANVEDMQKAYVNVDISSVDPRDLELFADLAEQTFKDQSIRKEVLSGEYPKKGATPSDKTIAKLQSANATRMSSDQNDIEWAVSTESILHYNIIAMEYDELKWAEVNDKQKGEPDYIPMRATMTIAGYDKMLMDLYPDLIKQDPTTGKPDCTAADKKFTERNDVRIKYRVMDDYGRVMDVDEIENMYSEVKVNFLKDDEGNPYRMNIKVTMDFNVEKDEYEEKQAIANLFAEDQESLVWLELFLESQGGTLRARKDEILEKRSKELEKKSLANQLMALPPEAMQMVMQYAQQLMAAQSQQQQQQGAGQPAMA